MNDTIYRQAAIEAVLDRIDVEKHGRDAKPEEIQWTLEKLPSAQPEIVRCKECKYWKDSDGVYRRGFDAESKCPLNLKKVYEGTFYCGMAERRTDENNNE